MKRRILLVDDEVTILLTLKAVLEISGFDVDIATSARDGKHKLSHAEFEMVITDMRMESEAAGTEVIAAARVAPYQPAIALLTAFPVADDSWQDMGADKMLVKPVHTRILLDQIEGLLNAREARLGGTAVSAPAVVPTKKKAPAKAAIPKKAPAKKAPAKKAVKKATAKKPAKRQATRKAASVRKAVKKTVAKKAVKKSAAKKPAAKARKPAAKKTRGRRR